MKKYLNTERANRNIERTNDRTTQNKERKNNIMNQHMKDRQKEDRHT